MRGINKVIFGEPFPSRMDLRTEISARNCHGSTRNDGALLFHVHIFIKNAKSIRACSYFNENRVSGRNIRKWRFLKSSGNEVLYSGKCWGVLGEYFLRI